ncbi:MAG: hypothetical protein AAB583_06265 [Patescibacteria group bacterium]
MKRKIKKSNSFTFLLIVFGGLLAILLVAFYYNKTLNNSYNQSQTNNNSNETKAYESKTLKFTIVVPPELSVKDEEIRFLISNSEGIIIVSRNGTQFDSLDNYLEDFNIKHKVQESSNEENLIIDNYTSLSKVIKYPGSTLNGDKIYFIYIPNAVYHISTSSEELFDELDEIAQSFKYTPN